MAGGTPLIDTTARVRPDSAPAPVVPRHDRTSWRYNLRKHWQLYTLVVLPLLFLLIFRYVPMAGNVIAFRRFRPGGSIFGDEWVGLYYVQLFVNDAAFWRSRTRSSWAC